MRLLYKMDVQLLDVFVWADSAGEAEGIAAEHFRRFDPIVDDAFSVEGDYNDCAINPDDAPSEDSSDG